MLYVARFSRLFPSGWMFFRNPPPNKKKLNSLHIRCTIVRVDWEQQKVAAILSTALERADRRHQELFRREDRALFPLARALHHLVRGQASVGVHNDSSGERGRGCLRLEYHHR